jgi:hypothetical protein
MSKFFSLNWRDVVKGLVVAFTTGVLAALKTLVQSKIDTNTFDFTLTDFYSVLGVALLAAVGYLLKQLGTDEDGKLGGVI